MGKRKNKLEDDIGDVFSGWAVSQKAKENPELYEPGKGKDSPPTRAKDQNRGAKTEGLKQTVKNTPSETDRQKQTLKNRPSKTDPQKRPFKNEPSRNVQRATSMTRHLSALRTLQSRTSFRIFTRSMRSFYQHLIRQIACPV